MWEGELDISLVLLQTFLFYSMEGKPGGTCGNGADERASNFTWQVRLWSVPLLQSNVPDGQYCLLMNVVQCIFVNWSLLKSGKVCCNHHTHEQLVHTMLMYTIKWRKKVWVLHIFDTHALFVLAFWVFEIESVFTLWMDAVYDGVALGTKHVWFSASTYTLCQGVWSRIWSPDPPWHMEGDV